MLYVPTTYIVYDIQILYIRMYCKKKSFKTIKKMYLLHVRNLRPCVDLPTSPYRRVHVHRCVCLYYCRLILFIKQRSCSTRTSCWKKIITLCDQRSNATITRTLDIGHLAPPPLNQPSM